jgi:hypothetical protein
MKELQGRETWRCCFPARCVTKSTTITIGGQSKVAAEITQIVKIVPNAYDQKVHQRMLDLAISYLHRVSRAGRRSSGEALQGAVLRNEHSS